MSDNIIELDENSLNIYKDHIEAYGWHIDRSNQKFKCQFKGCKSVVSYGDYFIMNEDCSIESYYCVKHGLKKFSEFKNNLDGFALKLHSLPVT